MTRMGNMFLRMLLLSFIALVALTTYAQDKPMVHSVKGDFKLPTPLGDENFREYMNGISDFNLYYQYPFAGNLTIGAGFKHSLYRVNDVQIPEISDGKMVLYTPFIKFSYEKFTSDRIFYDVGIKGGFSTMDYSSEICATTGMPGYSDSGLNIEPQMGIYLISQDNLAFGLLASYTLTMIEFTPENACISSDTNATVTLHGNRGFIQTFNIGFGFSMFIQKN